MIFYYHVIYLQNVALKLVFIFEFTKKKGFF